MSLHRQLDRKQPEGNGPAACAGEEGFMLLAMVVMVFLVLLGLSVAAPVIARQLRRDKEIESQHRMEQYVRAIELYQRKFPGQYPPSIKALEQSNNIRFLRHVYVDPLTGKADYRLIHQGEQKTKIHVFFGKELDSMSAGLGSAAGMQSSGGMGTPVGGASSGGFGSSSSSGFGSSSGSSFGSSMDGGSTNVSSTNALNSGFGGATIGGTGSTGATGSTGSTGSNGTGMFGDSTGAPIVGVGTSRTGTSVTQPNGQTTYETWEFWYDPAIEQLKQGVSLTGGGMSSQSASSFGQNAVTGQPNSGAAGSTGSTGSDGFGSNSFGSSFGSSSFGSSNSNGTNSNGSTGSTNSNSSSPF